MTIDGRKGRGASSWLRGNRLRRGSTQSARTGIRKTGAWVGLLGAVAILLVAVAPAASAATVIDPVSGGAFQLEGDAQQSTPAGTVGDDWDNICAAVVSPAACGGASATTTSTGVSWKAEPNPNSSIFTGGGSKDPSFIQTGPWLWKDGAGGLPDKDNLEHGFASRYSLTPSTTCPDTDQNGHHSGSCDVLFFGSDRFDNSGDAQQGFWFMQNNVSDNGGPAQGANKFTGEHKAGDVLIISDFSNGGTTSIISVYSWDTKCGTTEAIQTKPVNGQCADNNLRQLGHKDAAKCSSAPTPSQFCGIVNPVNGTVAPWTYTDKTATGPTHPANTYLQGEFYEGGLNLSSLGLGGECFASVLSETRASTSTSATLKDFVSDSFQPCGSSLTTTPSAGDGGSVSIGAGTVSGLTDSATVTVKGTSTWAGKVSFYLCGPDDLQAQSTCDTGGTQINGPTGGAGGTDNSVAVSNVSPTVSSSSAIVSKVGTYCWRGQFTSTTSGVPDAPVETNPDHECFTVTPVTPTLVTQASASVQVGNPVSDTATVTGAAHEPGSPVINPTVAGGPAAGTVTFTLFGPNNCSTVAFTSSAIPLSAAGTASSGNFTPTSAGTYHWAAVYSGDPPNTNGAGDASTACSGTDVNEDVVVTPSQPAISTVATSAPPTGAPVGTALDDTAHLTGTSPEPNGNAAAGTITFRLYGPDDASCATVIATRVVNVSGDGFYTASTGTGSGSLTPTLAGTYRWTADYSGDPPNTLSVSEACNGANEASLLFQLHPTIGTTQNWVPNDSATVTVSDTTAGALAGTIRFQLFTGSDCSVAANQVYDSTPIDITTGTGTAFSRTVLTNNTKAFGAPGGVFSWLVTYTSTNPGHTGVTSSCGTEHTNLSVADS